MVLSQSSALEKIESQLLDRQKIRGKNGRKRERSRHTCRITREGSERGYIDNIYGVLIITRHWIHIPLTLTLYESSVFRPTFTHVTLMASEWYENSEI